MTKITTIIKTKKTVFYYEDLHKIFSSLSKKALDQFLFRAKKKWSLLNPSRGIWTLPVYNNNELACMLKKNSYISLESVLYDAGAIFQAYFNTTTCVATQTATFIVNNKQFSYKKIKDNLFKNKLGIKDYDDYRIAMPERALCDYIYLYPKASLDNPQAFSKPDQITRLKALLPFYPKKTTAHISKLLGLSMDFFSQ